MSLPSLGAPRGRELVSRFAGLRVLVVGDVMLDRFIVGTVARISPEAPVPVVRYRRESTRLGGAANVAHNLAVLGARVSLVGVVGRDAAGTRLREALDGAGIEGDDLIADEQRRTTEKVRIVTERHQQVARIDYEEDADVTTPIERALVEAIRLRVDAADAVLVSDYLKGVVTLGVMRSVVDRESGAPVVVDPKVPHLDRYARATVLTPNDREAEEATHRRIRSDEDARVAGADFRARAACKAALITRGEHGMWLSSETVEGAVPAVAREVADVTGAGDTVVATFALALAAGATLAEAAVLANHAAGVVVGKFGAATVSVEELMAQFTRAPSSA